MSHLPNVAPLTSKLNSGAEGGHEFARICRLLLANIAGLRNWHFQGFNDSAGDYKGVDAFTTGGFGYQGYSVGFQFKFVKCPVKTGALRKIEESYRAATLNGNEFNKWILLIPEDPFKGDMEHIMKFRKNDEEPEIIIWGHLNIVEMFLHFPELCARYYPDLYTDSSEKMKRLFEMTYEQLKLVLGPCYGLIQKCEDEWKILSDDWCQYDAVEYIVDLPFRKELKEIIQIFETHYHLVFEKTLRDSFRRMRYWINANSLPDRKEERFQYIQNRTIGAEMKKIPTYEDNEYSQFVSVLKGLYENKQQIINNLCLNREIAY